MKEQKTDVFLFLLPVISSQKAGLKALSRVLFQNRQNGSALCLVSTISFGYFGLIGGVIAIICVGIFPISTGDTAMRASRLAIADALKMDQDPIINRFKITIPLFAVVVALLFVDFGILWRYFAWLNQTLAVFTLWAGATYLAKNKKLHWICTIPAMFMTFLTNSFILNAPIGFRLPV